MPKIYELFGYSIRDNSLPVIESRKRAFCPFTSSTCDGGGNRYMSVIDLNKHDELKELFPGLTKVPSGVCSVQLTDDSAPWIICPRRLLYMGSDANATILKGETQTRLLEKCGFPVGTEIGIWSEAKIEYTDSSNKKSATKFDYTFDYVLMPLGSVTQSQAVADAGLEWNVLEKSLRNSGHSFARRNGEICIEDFPVGDPVIVEVMTSSTSGGDKSKRSCIPQAFEDCVLGKPHIAPGINYRQVWARMASQLIVKSQAAIEWKGKTIWVLQDLLANYISTSTALDLRKFLADHTSEVNILAFSYGDNYKYVRQNQTVSLDNSTLYSGRIRSDNSANPQPCFQDIVLAAVCPPRNVLITALCKKKIANRMVL